MSDITIRPASPADIPTLIVHRHAMFVDINRLRGEEVAEELLAQMDERYHHFLLARFADGSLHGWVAADGDTIVAGALLTVIPGFPPSYNNLGGELPYVHDVYTQPDYRRRGIARQLVQQIIEFCREQKYPAVKLHASKEGKPVYEALGFQVTNEMRLTF